MERNKLTSLKECGISPDFQNNFTYHLIFHKSMNSINLWITLNLTFHWIGLTTIRPYMYLENKLLNLFWSTFILIWQLNVSPNPKFTWLTNTSYLFLSQRSQTKHILFPYIHCIILVCLWLGMTHWTERPSFITEKKTCLNRALLILFS